MSVLRGDTENDINIPHADDDVSSNADSDFIDVPDMDSDLDGSLTLRPIPTFQTNSPLQPDPSKDFRHSDLKIKTNEKDVLMEVFIKPSIPHNTDDDLFADIFKSNMEPALITLDSVQEKSKTGDELKMVDLIPAKRKSCDILEELKMQMDDVGKITLDTLTTLVVDDSDSEIELPLLPKKIETKPVIVDLNNILSNLNNEIETLAEITLDSVVLAPDLKTANKNTSEKNEIDEIIEINDGDTDEEMIVKTPKKTKQSTLGSFIEIKVTPTKSVEIKSQESPVTPKIASPFFRKKTPSSKKRSPPNEDTMADHSKVSKSLFADIDNVTKSTADVPAQLTAKDVIDVAASILRDQKSKTELSKLAKSAKETSRDLVSERNKQDRLGMSITDTMSADCKRLLRLFGVPYVVAPMEAEAQCAFLDAAKVTDGTITDDSDIWLFGGKTVYKHFFNQQKNVMEFRADTVERVFNVERDKLIQLAMLVGSDYTTGI